MSSPTGPAYAGFWRRYGAIAVDDLVLAVPTIFLESFAGKNFSVMLAISVLIAWAYFGTFHASPWQATLGKRAFGIKVTDLAGNRISFARSTGRYFASFISTLLLLLGYVVAAFTRKKQALHDMIAGTLVVSAETTPEALPADRAVMPLSWKTKVVVAVLVLSPFIIMMGSTFVEDAFTPDEVAESELAPPPSGPADEIEYAIYEVPFFKGEPRLVKEGKRRYAHADVQTVEGPLPGVADEEKVLSIANGFTLATALYREPRIDGFGLTISKHGQGFSWEWFNRQGEDVYDKLQGTGQVQVRFKRSGGKEQLAEILFLDDVTLRLDRYWLIPFHSGKSDLLVIKRGSVFYLQD